MTGTLLSSDKCRWAPLDVLKVVHEYYTFLIGVMIQLVSVGSGGGISWSYFGLFPSVAFFP
jgi:hypothetical protein